MPSTFSEMAASLGRPPRPGQRPVVCVQGLGFVGSAMAVAVADARDAEGMPCFDVIGIDLPSPAGQAKVDSFNAGILPVASADTELAAAFDRAQAAGNLIATTDPAALALATVAVVDIHLDVGRHPDGSPMVDFSGFRSALATLGAQLPAGALVLVETTVPPGTCAQVAAPELAAALERRGLPADALLLAHSYERVMPGKEYFRSIVNFWRVFAGHNQAAAEAVEAFLSKVINVTDYPLTRLHSTTASETAKVLENSYRAANIAFIEEWGRFAERVGINLFEVLDAIRVRPTHSNIRQPGFGVGGYCLTKDPLLAKIAARDLFGAADLDFPVSTHAVDVNSRMPLVTLERLRRSLDGLAGRHLLLLGVSYRQDVGDTRYSPSEPLVRAAEAEGATVTCHDPLVGHWEELDRPLPASLPLPADVDAVIMAVPHPEYRDLDIVAWLGTARPLVFDANNVLTGRQVAHLLGAGVSVSFIGRGDL